MNPQQPPGGAAHFAGYAQFYGSSTPARPPAFRPAFAPQQAQQYTYQHPQQTYQYAAPPMQVPPPRPPHLTGPPPPRTISAAAYNNNRWNANPPASAPSNPPVASNPSPTAQWQWNTGKAMPRPPPRPQASNFGPSVTIASAPPRPYKPSKFQDAPPPTVSKPPPPPVAAARPPASGGTQWPSTLKSYVERAFATCRSDADKATVQSILKEKITAATTADKLWTKNWDAEPLPLHHGAPPTKAPPIQPPSRPAAPPLRPPPLRPPMLPAGMVPPRPPMMRPPPMMPMRPPPPRPAPSLGKPSPFSDSFIPLDHSTGPLHHKKSTKRKPDADSGFDDGDHKKRQRHQRFLKDSFHANAFRTPDAPTGPLQVLNDEGELDYDAMIIRGTCLKVEKDYLRLTSAPHPSAVRPEPVLKKALELVRHKWKEGTCDYLYVVSQMKSIRQDCTVQHIKNDFTVLVYETHARIALEEGDMNEFNQCQTQLAQLYEHGAAGNRAEFLAYRILYSIYVCLQAKADNAGNVGMYRALSLVRAGDREDAVVAHALAVREAVFANDYQRFFKLYEAPPKMSGYLMDAYANHMRLQALKIMCKAYQPSVPMAFIKTVLQLEGKPGKEFVKECGIVLVNGLAKADAAMDSKASEIVSILKSSAKSLL